MQGPRSDAHGAKPEVLVDTIKVERIVPHAALPIVSSSAAVYERSIGRCRPDETMSAGDALVLDEVASAYRLKHILHCADSLRRIALPTAAMATTAPIHGIERERRRIRRPRAYCDTCRVTVMWIARAKCVP